MIDIGTIQGTIKLKNELTGELSTVSTSLDKFKSNLDQAAARLTNLATETNRPKESIKQLGDQTLKTSQQVTTETNKIFESYRRLASGLDPVIAGQHKYESAHQTLDAALGRGLITHGKYNQALETAKEKFLAAGGGASVFQNILGKVTELSSLGGQSARELGDGIGAATSKIGGLVEGLSSLGALLPVVAVLAVALVGLGAAFSAFEFLKSAIEEGTKFQVVVEQLNQSLRSTGASAGYSAKQLIDHAESLVLVSGRSKETIVQGELILTQFSKISHDAFPRATQAVLDYAQRSGKDVPEAAKKVGSALEGNAKSLTSLKDIGIVLSAGQKKTLADMIAVGDTAKYQSIIFGLLDEKVKGAAKAYAETLSGGIAIAHQEFSMFKETIASEVLPSLQYLFNDLVKQAGGWEHIHEVVQRIAHSIGNFIREMVFGIVLSYHQWEMEQALATANLDEGLKSFVHAALGLVITLLEGFAKLPSLLGGGDQWNEPIAAVKNFQAASDAALTEAANTARKSAAEHAKAYVAAGQALLDHKLALEGNTNVEKAHGNVEDEVAGKVAKHKAIVNEAARAIREYSDKVADLVDKLKAEDTTQTALLSALSKGIGYYDIEKQAQEQANFVRAQTVQLAKDHRAEIEKLTAAQSKLSDEGKASEAAKIQSDIESQNKAYNDQVVAVTTLATKVILKKQAVTLGLAADKEALVFTSEYRKVQAELTDAVVGTTQATHDFNIEQEIQSRILRDLATGDPIRIALITAEVVARHALVDTTVQQTSKLKEQIQSYKDINALLAKSADNRELRTATEEYGKTIASILDKYGLLSTASKQLAIEDRARAVFAEATNTRTLAQIEAELTARQRVIDQINSSTAAYEINQAVISQRFTQVSSIFTELSNALGGTNTQLGLITSSMSSLVLAVDKVRTAGKAFSADWTAAMVGAISQVGALVKSLDIGGSNKSGGAQALGGKLDSNYAGVGAIAGTIIGAIVAAVFSWGAGTGAGAALGGAIGTVIGSLISKAGDSASAALLAGGNIKVGETSKQLDGAIRDALLNIFKGLNAELAKLGLFLQGLPLIDIKVRDNIVRVVVGTVVRTFSSMADAISFGITEALRQSATSGGHLPPEVLAALKNSTATDLASLQSDIAFAQSIANYGVPAVVQAINKAVSDFFVSMQRAAQLGIDSAKIIAQFRDQIQAQKDAILGINTSKSPADQLKANVAAFNQRELLLKQETQLDLADLQLKRADLAGKIATLRGEVELARAHGALEKGKLIVDEASYKAQLELLKGMEDALAAIDVAIATSLGIIDSIILISEKELQDALKRLAHAGKGTGSSTAANTTAQLNAELEKLSRVNLPSAVNAIIDLGIQLADLTKRTHAAHGSETLLLAARQALIDQAKRAVTDPISQYLRPNEAPGGTFGISAFDQTLAGIVAKFNDARAANALLIKETGQSALAFWQINLAQVRALRAAGQDLLNSLNLPIRSTRQEATRYAQALLDINSAIKAGALTAAEGADAIQQLADQAALSVLGILASILEQEGKFAEADKVKRAADELNFNIQLIQFNLLYESYVALGLIAGDLKKRLDPLYALINDPTNYPNFSQPAPTRGGGTTTTGPGGGGSGGQWVYNPQTMGWVWVVNPSTSTGGSGGGTSAVQSARTLLDQYRGAQLDPLTASLEKVKDDFKSITDALGMTPEVISAYNAAIQKAIENFKAPIRQVQQSLFYGSQSTADVSAKFAKSQLDFAEAVRKFHSGDLSVVSSVPNLVQQLLGFAQQATPVGSEAYKAIFTEANNFLNEILSLQPADTVPLGANSNPMNVSGMNTLADLSATQIDKLDLIYRSTNGVIAAIETLNIRTSPTGLANVA